MAFHEHVSPVQAAGAAMANRQSEPVASLCLWLLRVVVLLLVLLLLVLLLLVLLVLLVLLRLVVVVLLLRVVLLLLLVVLRHLRVVKAGSEKTPPLFVVCVTAT